MAALMGLQHAFCMVGSLVTVPFVIFKFSFCHGVAKHKIALEAVLVTVQYHMDNRSKLFEALASSTNFYRIKNVFAEPPWCTLVPTIPNKEPAARGKFTKILLIETA
jgi:hypothetical protein